MNIYKKTFVVKCPSDNDMIVYDLEIHSDEMVRVEHINTAVALIAEGYQENIADTLYERFGGYQKITATHQGVEITTERGCV